MLNPNATKVSVKRTPLWERVLQCIDAVYVLEQEGHQDFTTTMVRDAIDPRLTTATIWNAWRVIVAKGLVTCTTPDKQKFRHYRVRDWDRLHTIRVALRHEDRAVVNSLYYDRGAETPIEPASGVAVVASGDDEPRSWWRRLLGGLTLRQRVRLLEERVDYLYAELGEAP